MAEKIEKVLHKWLIGCAFLIFILTAWSSIIINSMMGVGWRFDYSISRYVGSGVWSSVLFAAGNLFVSAFIGGFLWRLGENWKLKRWFYYVIVVMVVGLIGLSFCPLGICDFDGKISTVSWLHQIFSRLMFVMMLLAVMIIVWQQRAGVVARMVGGFFVVYGIVCAMGMMCHQSWFEQRVLIYETLYFMFFMAFLLILPQSEKNLQA